MLKLRHGDNFGRQAGARWRILFALALMPWLRKCRRHSHSNNSTKFEKMDYFSCRYDSRDVKIGKLELENLMVRRENAKLKQMLKKRGIAEPGGSGGELHRSSFPDNLQRGNWSCNF